MNWHKCSAAAVGNDLAELGIGGRPPVFAVKVCPVSADRLEAVAVGDSIYQIASLATTSTDEGQATAPVVASKCGTSSEESSGKAEGR
jgi:hypothetical protein